MPNIKQIIIIRTDLNMRKGKMIAQGAHASMKVLLDLGSVGYTWRVGQSGLGFEYEDDPNNPGDSALLIPLDPDMRSWVEGIFTKVVVGVESEEELLALRGHAEFNHIPNALIQDVGNTEFHGVPTYTALAVGPADATKIDPITGHLKLL